MAAKFERLFGESRPSITFHGSPRTEAQTTLEKLKMSEHIELWKMKSARQSAPLVLMFSWIRAPMPIVQKYANLYHQRGIDVLVVRGRFKHFFWPPSALKLSDELEKCLGEIPSYQKFFIHSFSVGTFNYTITRMCTRSGIPCFPSEKVIGQIYESYMIGDFVEFAEAIGIVITDNKLLQILIKKSLLFYGQLTSKPRDKYEEVNQFNKEEFLPVPSLFFYCENDLLSNGNYLKELLALLRGKHGDNIREKSWPISTHVGHLRSHRDDYLSIWNSFVNELGL